MRSRADLELDFAGRFVPPLLDPCKPVPGGLSGPKGKKAERRFNVYRNNVTVSLIEALGDIFPATRRIVGETFFQDMARLFVRSEPPTSPLLFEYGYGFPQFIDRFEHTASLPWLGDVARIERAWLDAFHTEDVPPLRPETLGAIAQDRLAEIRFLPHPATRVLRSAFPAVTIFAANRSKAPVGKILERDGEDALITRPHLEVFVRKLPIGGAVFLQALIDGQNLGDAASIATRDTARFDLSANIAGMLDAGVFCGLSNRSDAELGEIGNG